MRRPSPRSLGPALACAWIVASATGNPSVSLSQTRSSGAFTSHTIGSTRWLTDLTLVDLNGDGLLDLTTSNHAIRPLFLENQGSFEFSTSAWADALAGTDASFPLLAGRGEPEALSDTESATPGLYIYGRDVGVRLVAVGLDTGGLDTGGAPFTLLLPPHADPAWIVPVDAMGSVKIGAPAEVLGRFAVPLHLDGDASVTLAPIQGRWEIDATLLIPGSVSPGSVFLGPDATPNAGWRVPLSMRDAHFDWHGTAWADLNGDGLLDLYANQGGYKGRAIPGATGFNDILRLSAGNGAWIGAASETGINSMGRPGRGVQPVDVDRDGRLDFYVTNSRNAGPPTPWPNALHMQRQALSFTDEAGSRRVDFPGHGHAVWFDADLDGWMDLAWGDSDGVWIMRNREGLLIEAERPISIPGKWSSSVSDLAVADADRDGDLDLVVAQRPVSYVLRNEGGAFTPIPFDSLGLPPKCWGTHWVDANNDGATDLYLQPHGLFLGNTPDPLATGFRNPELLRDIRDWSPFAWGDLDGDGRPDLVRPGNRSETWIREARDLESGPIQVASAPLAELIAYQNRLDANGHWIHLDLIGPPGNSQAIGTTVLLDWDGRSELALVGQANASGASMGQYRLEFGLGSPQSDGPPPLADVHLRWSDGLEQTIEGLEIDGIRTISHPRADR